MVSRTLTIGEKIAKGSHVEFIDWLCGTLHERYSRCIYPCYRRGRTPTVTISDAHTTWSHDTLIWMVRIDNEERYEWTNRWLPSGDIEETYHNNRMTKPCKDKYRAVFEIVDEEDGRKYVFRGIFGKQTGRNTTVGGSAGNFTRVHTHIPTGTKLTFVSK